MSAVHLRPGFVGAVLAGGKSTRMGQDKALLPYQGRPLVLHVLAALTPVCQEVIVVGRDPGWLPGARSIPDLSPGCGPLGGLITALAAAEGRPVFAAGCDMPTLKSPCVLLTCARLEGYEAAVPCIGGRDQPLHAAYSPAALSIARDQFRLSEFSLRRLLARLRVNRLPESEFCAMDQELSSFVSLNTPEEYRIGVEEPRLRI